MGACCTTGKQELKSQQLKKPIQKPQADPTPESPSKSIKSNRSASHEPLKRPDLTQKPSPKTPSKPPTRPEPVTSPQVRSQTKSPKKIPKELLIKNKDSKSVESADLDENIVNLQVSINQSKEENRVRFKDVNRQLDSSVPQKELPKIDLTPPAATHKPIYHISHEFPVARPYSSPQEWQKVLSKHVFKQSQIVNEQAPESEDDQLMESLLNLANRNWLKDQIGLHIENMNCMQDSLDSLVRQKKSIQLREHFTWLVWAVAQYFFRTNMHVNTDPVPPALAMQDSASQYQSDSISVAQSDYSKNSTQSFVSSTGPTGATIQTGPTSGGVSSKANKPLIAFTNLPIKLPKTSSDQWVNGFTYKGVYFKLLPYEDSLHIRQEMRALKYATIELLDLQMLDSKDTLMSPKRSSNIHKELILPLLAGVQCAGFYLYGTPVIYTPDVPRSPFQSATKQAEPDFGLPRVGSCVPEFCIAPVRNQYEQIIDAISMSDPSLEMMPILKNITRANLVPIVDFEEYSTQTKGKGRPQAPKPTVNYLTLYLKQALRSLSTENTASVLFMIPQLNTEEISFYPFPADRQLAQNELEAMLKTTNGSLKPRGDIASSPQQHSLHQSQMHSVVPVDDEDPGNLQINRRLLYKHGWQFTLIERTYLHQTSKQENKRACQFYNQRENYGEVKEASIIDTRVKQEQVVTQRQEDKTPRKEDFNMLMKLKQQISAQKEETRTDRENIESSPERSLPIDRPDRSPFVFLSPQKRTILRKAEPSTEETLSGNCVVAGTLTSGFHLKFSLSQHTYSSGIEAMFKLSLDSVAGILDQSDRISNMYALKELMHRKGLNLRFLWVLLGKVKLQQSRDLIMASILCRTMRRIVNEEAKIKSKSGRKLIKMQGVKSPTNIVQIEKVQQLRGILDIYKDILTLYVNALVRNKFAKYKQVFDETLLGLFLSRMKAMCVLTMLDLTQSEVNYLESKDILDHIVELPSRNPIMFLNSVQVYFGLTFKPEYLRQYRQDKYIVLNKNQPLAFNDIQRINMQVQSYFTMREQAYLILARKIAFNRQAAAEHVIKCEASFTERETSRGAKTTRKNNGDTERAFQNMEGPRGPFRSNFQNIIDLSKVKKTGFKPITPSEVFMPSVLYKLQTQVHPTTKHTVLEPYYEMPNIDVINEWVIVLESLFKDVYSAYGSEQVLIEALIFQCLLTFFIEADQDSAFKILTKVRDLLQESLYCSPEIIVMCMMLTGLLYDVSDEIENFPIESEKNYLVAMVLAFQIYGDPRGRGNYSIPYCLFFSWKLSLLALAESRKLHDSELAEEMFDATLASLYNHKKIYRRNQIDIVSAQDKAKTPSELGVSNLAPSGFPGVAQGKTNFSQQFEMQVDVQEMKQCHFNLNKFARRQRRIVTTAGFTRNMSKKTLDPIAESGKPLETETMSVRMKNEDIGTKINNRSQFNAHPSILSSAAWLKENKQIKSAKKQGELDSADIELQLVEDFFANSKKEGKPTLQYSDETQQVLAKANFRNGEQSVGNMPFPHWTINRQILTSHQQAIQNEKPPEQKRLQKEFVKEQITKNLDIDTLFAWLINFNPMMVSCGQIWDSRTIKEVVFCPNQHIVNSSDSSIAFSNNKLSQYSSKSDTYPQRKRKQHLGPYQQCLSKEVGGIQKGEIMGSIYTWGADQFGQLGLDNFVAGKQSGSIQSMKILHPRLLVPLKNELIKEICCGYSHTLAVNQYGQLYVWGNNESGQLGLGSDEVPTMVRRPILNNFVQNVQRVSASHEHSMALTKMGELFTWGSSMLTGLGEKEDRHTPLVMDYFKPHKITQVCCGGLHTMVLTNKGHLYSWGSAEGGQIGIPELTCESIATPQKLETIANIKIVQVACGEAHTVALADDGKVWGWGMSMYGQLGLGFSGDSFEPGVGMLYSRVNEPREITPFLPPQAKITQIHCGAMYTLFLTEEFELYGCGINDLGQLGLDTYLEEMQVAAMQRARMNAGVKQVVTSDVTVPSRVICFEGMKVSSLACGENHSLALVGDEKSLWAWGMFKNGQLGLGEVTMKMNPRPIQSLCNTNIHRLAAGSQHSLALLGDSAQLQNLSHSFYLNSDLLNNPWLMDMRKLLGDNFNEVDDQS